MELYLSLFTPLSFFLRGEQRHEIKIRRKNWPVRRMFALAGPEAFIYSLTRSPCLSISLFLLSPPSFSFRKRKHGRSISLRWAAISFLFYSFLSLSFRLAVKFSVSRDCRTLPARETRLRSLSLSLSSSPAKRKRESAVSPRCLPFSRGSRRSLKWKFAFSSCRS